MGISPLHASSVGIILNPNTNRLRSQYYCVYNDYFETVTFSEKFPLPNWDEIVIKNLSQLDLELDPDDPKKLINK